MGSAQGDPGVRCKALVQPGCTQSFSFKYKAFEIEPRCPGQHWIYFIGTIKKLKEQKQALTGDKSLIIF